MLPYFSTGFLDIVKQGMDYTSLRRVFLSIFMANMYGLPPKFDIQLGWPVSRCSGMLGHMAQHAASAASMCRACPWRTMPDCTEWQADAWLLAGWWAPADGLLASCRGAAGGVLNG